jgi:hypothetical protein
MAPPFHNPETGWTRVFSLTFRPIYWRVGGMGSTTALVAAEKSSISSCRESNSGQWGPYLD